MFAASYERINALLLNKKSLMFSRDGKTFESIQIDLSDRIDSNRFASPNRIDNNFDSVHSAVADRGEYQNFVNLPPQFGFFSRFLFCSFMCIFRFEQNNYAYTCSLIKTHSTIVLINLLT